MGRPGLGERLSRLSIVFAAPGAVVVEQEPRPSPGPGELLVATEVSAISAIEERLMRRIIAKGLTVRDAERLAQVPDAEESGRKKRTRNIKDADTRALEKALEDRLGLKCDIRHSAGGQGELRITYRSLDQLEALCRLLQA